MASFKARVTVAFRIETVLYISNCTIPLGTLLKYLCKGLSKSKLDITRCLLSIDVVFSLGDEWCCQCITITLFSRGGNAASSVNLHAPQNTIELLTHLARVDREGPNPSSSI